MQIYFHSRLWSYLPRVPILVEGTVCNRPSLLHSCICNQNIITYVLQTLYNIIINVHRHKLLKMKCIKIVLKCTSCVSYPAAP